MAANALPALPAEDLTGTRLVCHACARLLGGWTASCRSRRKHWWQLSLRPSLRGVRTGLLHAGEVDFELELDLAAAALRCETADGFRFSGALAEASVPELAIQVGEFLREQGVPPGDLPVYPEQGHESLLLGQGQAYVPEIGIEFAAVWRFIGSAMDEFRAGKPEEMSPIMIWPGHFDMAIMWLAGEKIPGQDPADEEHSDKQMNFGFSFGDDLVPGPYFYVTAYPNPEAFAALSLPTGARWQDEGFSGVVLDYAELAARDDPHGDLLALWNYLIENGRRQLLARETGG